MKVALLTPDHEYQGRWKKLIPGYRAAIENEELAFEALPWDSDRDLTQFDLVLPLLAWSYFRKADKWRGELAEWKECGVRIQNSVSALRWNTGKTYLEELAAKSIPTIPTIFTDALTEECVMEAYSIFGVEQIVLSRRSHAAVIKP